MTEMTKGFCGHQNFVPWGFSASDLRLSTFIKSKKMCIKSEVEEILFKLATKFVHHNDEALLLT